MDKLLKGFVLCYCVAKSKSSIETKLLNFIPLKSRYSVTSSNKKIKKEGKDQESIQSSTTPDPGYQWESDNVTIRHHKREPKGQPFPSS